jgi:hypothetical protein
MKDRQLSPESKQQRSCEMKIPYCSKREAKAAMPVLKRKYPGDNYDIYHCRFCGHWHIGRTIGKGVH